MQAPLILVALWLAALVCFWWPRRARMQEVGLTVVMTMVVIGGVLSTASLLPCRGAQSDTAVAGWVLDLYAGNPPPYPTAVCQGQPPLALQLGGVICLGATLAGALVAAAVLWRQPLDRMRARLVRDAVIFTGLDAVTLPLLRRLAETGRAASIVVVEPDRGHPLLDEARAVGVHVMIGQPTSARVLLPVIAGRDGCALRHLYALRDHVADNEAVLAAAETVLRRYRPDAERQPHLVARIDDPRHADHWRGSHIGPPGLWLEDALSANETTASAVADRVFRTGARQLLLCGDSMLALAILRELSRRAWERRQLAQAATVGRSTHPDATPADVDPQSPGRLPVERVVLLDQRSEDLRREYLATSPPLVARALPSVHARPRPWKSQLLATLDAMTPAEATQTAVVVADQLSEGSMHEAGRVARLHPGIPVFVLTSEGAGATGAIFDRLQPFQRGLLVDGELPEDSWTRVARHWHECYRLGHPPVPDNPRALTGRPWHDLDDFIRQDNILQLRSIMAAVMTRGRQWVPGRAVAAGSFIELNEHDLEEIAKVEHTRWYARRLAAGWSAGGRRGDRHVSDDAARVNRIVVPWAELSQADQTSAIEHLRSQLAQLEEVGFMPVVPEGGPSGAAVFERIGTVHAERLQAPRPWTRASGDRLTGGAGDWRVLDDSGNERTVRDTEFRSSHEYVNGEYWRRTGTFRAWRVSERLVLRTMEGRAVAQPGDWVVEGHRGERWPVPDDQFRRTYR